MMLNEADASVRHDNDKFKWENERTAQLVEFWTIPCGRRLRWFRTMISSPGRVLLGVQGGAPESVWAEPQDRKTPVDSTSRHSGYY